MGEKLLKRKTERRFCQKLGKSHGFHSVKEGREKARRIFQETGNKLYVYKCMDEPCRDAGVVHLTGTLKKGIKARELNGKLVNFYDEEENKGDGRASKRIKARARKGYFAKRTYRLRYLPVEQWENEGGAFIDDDMREGGDLQA